MESMLAWYRFSQHDGTYYIKSYINRSGFLVGLTVCGSLKINTSGTGEHHIILIFPLTWEQDWLMLQSKYQPLHHMHIARREAEVRKSHNLHTSTPWPGADEEKGHFIIHIIIRLR